MNRYNPSHRPEDENDWIDDNGDHSVASYDREGLAYYTDPATAKLNGFDRGLAAKKLAAKKPAAKAPVDPELKRLQDLAKSRGFKSLSGSAKQKKWGESIRAQKTAGVTDEYLIALFSSVEKAKDWIDMRDMSARVIAKELGEGMMWARSFIEINLSRQHGHDYYVVEGADLSQRYSEDIGADRAAAYARRDAIIAEMKGRLEQKISSLRW